jgi:selenobiotic family peptide radical SAM maturase
MDGKGRYPEGYRPFFLNFPGHSPVTTPAPAELSHIYPACTALLGEPPQTEDPLQLPELLAADSSLHADHPFLPDLAAVERARYLAGQSKETLPRDPETLTINPSLELLPVQWRNLPALLADPGESAPDAGEEHILVYLHPDGGGVETIQADGHDLLALKLVSEEMDAPAAAREGGVTVGTIDDILRRAVSRGLLIAPASRIKRADDFPRGTITDPRWFTSPTFTLQWHITQVCDLHCRHCYDRSDRTTMDLGQGIRILDDLYAFSRAHNVHTQVTFTGGNPLLYPHFIELYQAAADRGFMLAILGNPMPRHRIEEMLAIRRPEFYQVSLEGLREHNDYIRGEGHFERVFDFLDLLRELDVYSMVMLTLTKRNMGEVLDLAELLRDRTDLFTFNRLAMVGEGAALASAPVDEFPAFLEAYMEAAGSNPCMSLKDNFFNLLRHQKRLPYGGGCAGFGCGAAFNFVSLLPDGEVHACRKLPSHIGNMFEQSLDEIYHNEAARRYRLGSAACAQCDIRPVCGGCLAVSYGFGDDIFQDLDPYCFLNR